MTPRDSQNSPASRILVRATAENPVYQHLTPARAGWDLLHCEGRMMRGEEKLHIETGDNEYVVVLFGGTCTVHHPGGTWDRVGRRPNVFAGMPYAFYLSRRTSFEIAATSDELDLALAWCRTDQDHPARLVTPEQVAVEIRGGGNATRQINSLLPPGSDCHRLVAVEVFTPAGNWSSYPPHKHDVHKTDAQGSILEADLEEIYFYKIDKPEGFAVQRVYTDDRSLDEVVVARNNDIVLVPEGYHPVAAAHGYNVYYVNFLAGSAQSLATSDDPEHAWIKGTWKEKDPRVPVVSMAMEETQTEAIDKKQEARIKKQEARGRKGKARKGHGA
jgi:5-deoxy-glucuronate isomerase